MILRRVNRVQSHTDLLERSHLFERAKDQKKKRADDGSGDLDLCEFVGISWSSKFLLLSVCSEIRLELSFDSGNFVIVSPYEIDTEKLVRMESVK
jgi:hypothetical protein